MEQLENISLLHNSNNLNNNNDHNLDDDNIDHIHYSNLESILTYNKMLYNDRIIKKINIQKNSLTLYAQHFFEKQIKKLINISKKGSSKYMIYQIKIDKDAENYWTKGLSQIKYNTLMLSSPDITSLQSLYAHFTHLCRSDNSFYLIAIKQTLFNPILNVFKNINKKYQLKCDHHFDCNRGFIIVEW